jgi:hypothetical protein
MNNSLAQNGDEERDGEATRGDECTLKDNCCSDADTRHY